MIQQCNCKHEGQDKIHGKQMRVKNLTAGTVQATCRCTVCGATKNIGVKKVVHDSTESI